MCGLTVRRAWGTRRQSWWERLAYKLRGERVGHTEILSYTSDREPAWGAGNFSCPSYLKSLMNEST